MTAIFRDTWIILRAMEEEKKKISKLCIAEFPERSTLRNIVRYFLITGVEKERKEQLVVSEDVWFQISTLPGYIKSST